MKKIFNNKGVTLIEVIAAVTILGIISVPIITTLIQTTKINVSSDVEMKMKAQAEQIIETIKAQKSSSAGPFYYDKGFNETDAAKASYRLEVDNSTVNAIETAGEYDRWDFKVGLSKGDSGTRVRVYYNNGYRETTYSGVNNSLGGKLFLPNELNPTIPAYGSNAVLDFKGGPSYLFNYYVGGIPKTGTTFTPGHGAINSTENTIIVDVFREDASADNFNLSINNNTCYNGTDFYVVNGQLSYLKNVIVNVYNDDPASPKITVNQNSPCITVNRTSDSMPRIINGQKININVIDAKTGKTVKVIPSVIE